MVTWSVLTGNIHKSANEPLETTAGPRSSRACTEEPTHLYTVEIHSFRMVSLHSNLEHALH